MASDGSWRTPPIEEKLERHQLAHALELRGQRIEQLEMRNRKLTSSRKAIIAGEAAGPACSALAAIMTDGTVSVRKRIQAAANLLEFKSPPDLADAAKLFLASVFEDRDQNVDDRLQATMALRKSEDVRIMPPIERPPPRADVVDPELPRISLAELVAQRRARADRMELERLESPEATPQEKEAIRASISRRKGNGSGNGGDSGSE